MCCMCYSLFLFGNFSFHCYSHGKYSMTWGQGQKWTLLNEYSSERKSEAGVEVFAMMSFCIFQVSEWEYSPAHFQCRRKHKKNSWIASGTKSDVRMNIWSSVNHVIRDILLKISYISIHKTNDKFMFPLSSLNGPIVIALLDLCACTQVPSHSGRYRRPINMNHYANKKSAVESMLDVALLMANAAQLKAVLEQGPGFTFYAALIALLSISLILQVVVGILLIFIGRRYWWC